MIKIELLFKDARDFKIVFNQLWLGMECAHDAGDTYEENLLEHVCEEMERQVDA